MGKKISQITIEESTSISDTDWFEGEESGGTSFKTAFSVIKSTLKSYFDTLYLSGLAVSTASVTTSNVTGVEGTLHNLDVSGMTANRDFNLPTPSAAGKRVGVHLSTGDDTYALIVKINSVEWSRLFITNETVIFVSTGTGAGNWVIESDSRIPQTAQMKSTAVQSIANNTFTQMTFDTEVYDVGDIASISTEKITVRRDGKYMITGTATFALLDATRLLISIYINGTGYAAASLHASFSSNLTPFVAGIFNLAAGDYIELYILHTYGSTQNTVASNDNSYPRLSLAEVL